MFKVPGTGLPILPGAGATVHVYARDTTTHAAIYSAASGATTLSQPLTADSLGSVPGYVDEGSYDLALSGTVTPRTYRWEAIHADSLAALSGAFALKANLPINVEDYASFQAAWNVAMAAGGGVLQCAPFVKTYTLPTSGLSATSGNITILGGGMNVTTLLVTNGDNVILQFDGAATPYENIHVRDLTLQMTGTNAQTEGLVMGSITNWSVDRVRVTGPWYPMVIGGHGGYAPAKHGSWTRSILDGVQYDNAIINAEDVNVTDNTFIGGGNSRPLIDLEPNGETDSLKGLVIARNKLYCQGISGGIQMAWGSAADPQRVRGVQVVDNQIFDPVGGIACNLPGAIIRGNVIKAIKPYIGGYAPSGAISIQRSSAMPAADECIVEGNEIDNMVAVNKVSAISIEGASHCRVRGNVVHEDAGTPLTGYPVQETQRYAGIVSGFTLGTPSAMTVPVAAGVLQKDATGLFPAYVAGALVTKTAQTATIPTASAYDRIDTIYLDPVTAVVSVKQGNQALHSQATAPSQPAGNYVIVGYVYVTASVTSITADKLSDSRTFVAHDNEIDHSPGFAPSQLGDVGLVNPNSSRRVRRIPPLRSDGYTRSVLDDRPLIYLPMTERSGLTVSDYGAYGGVGYYVGGVSLNQQIGATTRYGTKFDGTGTVQIQRPDELIVNGALCLAPFTLEIQALPDNTSDYYNFAFQGFSSSKDFEWGLYSNTKQFLDFGDSSDQVSPGATISTTTINHLAVDWDGTNLRFYTNGTVDGAALTPAQPAYNFNAGYSYLPIHVGYNDNATHTLFPGFLRHFAMYSPNIGATRIAAHAALM